MKALQPKKHMHAFHSCQALERKIIYVFPPRSDLPEPLAASTLIRFQGYLSASNEDWRSRPTGTVGSHSRAERRFICFPAEIKVVKSLREAGVCMQKEKAPAINLAACRRIHQRFLGEQRELQHTALRARLPLLAAPKGTFYYGSYAFYEDHHVGCGAVSLIKWRALIPSQTAIPVIGRAAATRLSSPEREPYLGRKRAERLRRVDAGLVHTHG